MSKHALTSQQLHGLPFVRGLEDNELELVAALFEPRQTPPGDCLFRAGEPAAALYLLTDGEVALLQGEQETHRLRPPVLFGEIGALANLTRNSTAIAGEGAEVWQVTAEQLLRFFATHQQIGLAIQRSLLEIAGNKINEDQTRLADMRQNIIRTQKAMKRMRDFLLESQDTVVSRPLHEILEGLIKQNRRVNYRVKPPFALPALWRMDDGGEAAVVQISRTHVSYALPAGELPQPLQRVSAVLTLCGPEIPVSGKVLRTIDRRVDVELDLLIEEYAVALEGYLTRVQLLDFLV